MYKHHVAIAGRDQGRDSVAAVLARINEQQHEIVHVVSYGSESLRILFITKSRYEVGVV